MRTSIAFVLLLSACGDDSASPDAMTELDATAGDAVTTDGAVRDSAMGDAALDDSSVTDGSTDDAGTVIDGGPPPSRCADDLPATVLATDFDWNAIGSELAGSAWEVAHDFDLGGSTVTLPPDVCLSFAGGSLANGVLSGDNTSIESTTDERIFDGVDLAGEYATEYLDPAWFGAVMNGTSDDRSAFVETLEQSNNIGARVMVDRDMFLDVAELGSKSIFIEDNTWIEGRDGARIIINNLLSPAFIAALTENIMFRNVEFLYDQTYDAAFGYDANMISRNQAQLETYLTETKGITFVGKDPYWSSPVNFRYTFLLSAARDVTFENVTMRARGETADTFMVGAVKLKEEFAPNQTVSQREDTTVICTNIVFRDVTMDGVIMGIQGVVDGFTSENFTARRYSDTQRADGSHLGGNDGSNRYWMPPPHLYYINSDGGSRHSPRNIEILNTVDHGEYVGNENVRATLSGYCNSLKLTDDVYNVNVDGYVSHRRDGFADMQHIHNGTFRNISVESRIEIFNRDWQLNSLRFLGTLDSVTFEDMTIVDLSTTSTVYPLDRTEANDTTFRRVTVRGMSSNCFRVTGSGNSIEDSDLAVCD